MHFTRTCLSTCLAAGLALCCLLPLSAFAETQTVTVTHTYVMGDSESKNEARANCLAEAKRRIAEEAGAYVEVMSRTRNFQMAEDEVLSFTAAILRVRVDEEKIAMDGGTLSITLTVTGEVDPETVRARLDELAERRLAERDARPLPPVVEDEAFAPQLPEQPEQAEQAEQQTPAANTPAPVARAKDPYAAKQRMERSLEQDTRMCVELTEKGMARSEVEHLLGEPRLSRENSSLGYSGAKYGDVWVVYKDDEVACVRSRLENRATAGGDIHCRGFAFNFVTR